MSDLARENRKLAGQTVAPFLNPASPGSAWYTRCFAKIHLAS
jgi:hypothetical protein